VISSGLLDYYSPRSIMNTGDLVSGGGTAKKENSNTVVLLHESVLTYQTRFNEHSLKFTGVFATQSNSSNSNTINASNFPNDATANEALQLAVDKTVSSARNKDRLDSYMGRINYAFRISIYWISSPVWMEPASSAPITSMASSRLQQWHGEYQKSLSSKGSPPSAT